MYVPIVDLQREFNEEVRFFEDAIPRRMNDSIAFQGDNKTIFVGPKWVNFNILWNYVSERVYDIGDQITFQWNVLVDQWISDGIGRIEEIVIDSINSLTSKAFNTLFKKITIYKPSLVAPDARRIEIGTTANAPNHRSYSRPRRQLVGSTVFDETGLAYQGGSRPRDRPPWRIELLVSAICVKESVLAVNFGANNLPALKCKTNYFGDTDSYTKGGKPLGFPFADVYLNRTRDSITSIPSDTLLPPSLYLRVAHDIIVTRS